MLLTLIAGLMLFAFTACAGNSNAIDPLDGTSWKLVSYHGADVIAEQGLTAQFENETVSGSAGCNSYGGTYQVDGETIQIKDIISTLMACTEPQGVMEQEAGFLGDLTNAQTFHLVNGQLEIVSSTGETLTFSPQ